MFKYVRSTLVKIFQDDKVLLGMKKRGLGVGKWNGFGGKLNKDETLKECAVREVLEESSLSIKEEDLQQIGILLFEFIGENLILEVNVFRTNVFCGTPLESEEMNPCWFLLENIPYQTMWADDILWYPLMLKNNLFYGFFKFHGHDNMVSENLQVVKSVEEMETLRNVTKKSFNINSSPS